MTKISVNSSQTQIISIRLETTEPSGTISTLLKSTIALPMAAVFPLIVSTNAELPWPIIAILGTSAITIMALIFHINRNRLQSVTQGIQNIRANGLANWYQKSFLPSYWPTNTLRQIPYNLSFLATVFIASQSYPSVLNGLLSSLGTLIKFDGTPLEEMDAFPTVAIIVWVWLFFGNLSFNLHFLTNVMNSMKGVINWSSPKVAVNFSPFSLLRDSFI